MDFSKVIIRSSASGRIMTNDRSGKNFGETCKTYLAELYRELKYSRRKEFTAKEIEKGVIQEELAITLLSLYLKKYLKKNKERLTNTYITGEPDCYIGKSILAAEEGYDTKCSWSLWTFPYEGEEIKKDYFYQNHCYMALTGAKKWTTAHCLVNAPADMITAEKQRVWYALGMPDEDNERYMSKRIEIEKNMIFDMAQFKKDNPNYDLDISDWKYDIPIEERVALFPVVRDEEVIKAIYKRVEECRAYMESTYKAICV